MVLNILGWIIFGLIVGAVAKVLVPGNDSNSWINSILLGIAGSFVGGILSSLLFGSKGENFVRYSGWLMSIVGSIILLLLFRFLF